MPTIDDRVALLERQVSEILPLRDAVTHLEHRMDTSFQAVERRFERIDHRIDALGDKVSRQLEALDNKTSRQFEVVHDRMSRQFMWLVGIQVTTLAAIVAALLARA